MRISEAQTSEPYHYRDCRIPSQKYLDKHSSFNHRTCSTYTSHASSAIAQKSYPELRGGERRCQTISHQPHNILLYKSIRYRTNLHTPSNHSLPSAPNLSLSNTNRLTWKGQPTAKMGFFYSKSWGGKRFGGNVVADRHGVRRPTLRFRLFGFNCFRSVWGASIWEVGGNGGWRTLERSGWGSKGTVAGSKK